MTTITAVVLVLSIVAAANWIANKINRVEGLLRDIDYKLSKLSANDEDEAGSELASAE